MCHRLSADHVMLCTPDMLGKLVLLHVAMVHNKLMARPFFGCSYDLLTMSSLSKIMPSISGLRHLLCYFACQLIEALCQCPCALFF